MFAPIYKLSRGVLFGDPEHALGPLSDPDAVASNVTRLAHHIGGIGVYSAKHGSHLLKAGAEVDTLIRDDRSSRRSDARSTAASTLR